ncbi:MAG: GldG family protein [Polyangiaceae bacterium]
MVGNGRGWVVAALVLAIAGCGSKKSTHSSETRSSTPSGSSTTESDAERSILSRPSRRIAHRLKETMSIRVFATSGMPDNDALIGALKELFAAYAEASKQSDGEPRIRFEFIDPKSDEQRREAKDAGIQEQTFATKDANVPDKATVMRGFMGIAFAYAKEKDTIPYWPPNEPRGLEFFISHKMHELLAVTEGTRTRIGVITGKDEIKLSDDVLAPGDGPYNLKSIFAQYLPMYDLVEIDLGGGERPIDDGVDGVLVTQPGKDYTERELRQIDAFVMRGGKSLTVLASAVNLRPYDASLTATLSTHGLAPLLSGYGVEMHADLVSDWEQSFALPLATPEGEAKSIPVWWVPAPAPPSLDDTFLPFFRLKSLTLPFASSLSVHADRQPDATVKARARSSPTASVQTGSELDLGLNHSLMKAPPAGSSQQVLAVSVEGPLRSAFDAELSSKSPSNVLVIASSGFPTNPFARAGKAPPMPPQLRMMGGSSGDHDLLTVAQIYSKEAFPTMVLALKNTFDWMSGDPDLRELNGVL